MLATIGTSCVGGHQLRRSPCRGSQGSSADHRGPSRVGSAATERRSPCSLATECGPVYGRSPALGELRPSEPLVPAAGPVADRVGRVVEEVRPFEPADRPHREGALDPVVADVGRRSGSPDGRPARAAAAPSARADSDSATAPIVTSASIRASTNETTKMNCSSSVPKSDSGWPAPAKASRATSLGLRPDERQARQRFAQVAPALDHAQPPPGRSGRPRRSSTGTGTAARRCSPRTRPTRS